MKLQRNWIFVLIFVGSTSFALASIMPELIRVQSYQIFSESQYSLTLASEGELEDCNMVNISGKIEGLESPSFKLNINEKKIFYGKDDVYLSVENYFSKINDDFCSFRVIIFDEKGNEIISADNESLILKSTPKFMGLHDVILTFEMITNQIKNH